MARDTAQESRDNINQGLPAESGLDEGTRASIQRSLDGGAGQGIKVGSFRDLQVGDTDVPLESRPLNPNQPDGAVPVTDLPDAVGPTKTEDPTDTKSKSKK